MMEVGSAGQLVVSKEALASLLLCMSCLNYSPDWLPSQIAD